MWSEHCSYKSSKRWLKLLPTEAPWVICGPGENAGVVDIGDGQAVIFKMESHNHPSYIEPYQGAATGVGGILRDVFTMGARPIANLNSLRFGDSAHPKTRHLVAGVVGGIAGYGNCVGVPTVAGECTFHRGYDGNILVNAMTVGLARADRIFYSAAAGTGQSAGLCRLENRARRHPRRHHGVGRVQRRDRGEAADGADRRSVHREAADRSVSGANGDRRDHRHPGHGRGRPHLLVVRDGLEGRRRCRAGSRQGADPRDRYDRLRDHAVGEPGANADGAAAGGGGRGARHLREVGAGLRRRRPDHRYPPHGRPSSRRGGGGCADRAAGRGGAGVRPAATADAAAAGARCAHAAAAERPDGGARAAARLPRPRQQALDLGTVRPHGAGGDRAAAGGRRRRAARARHAEGHCPHLRLHAALLPRRPGRGRPPGGRGSLAQPDRGGGEAARDHRLPQFRQPRETGDHGPVRFLHRGNGRGVPRARLPGRLRQRVVLQRDQRRG